MYALIDGDDVGKKMEVHTINNDVEAFIRTSERISNSIARMAESLADVPGVSLVSTGGDSILIGFHETISNRISERLDGLQAEEEFSFSVGIGNDLREAYVALRMAKAAGKRCTVKYFELS